MPRSLPVEPRGRFTQVEAERAPLEALEGPAGRTTLETLLAQHGHRPALLRALAQGYTGRRGSDPSAAELDVLLTEHGLIAAVEDERARASSSTRSPSSGGRWAASRGRWGCAARSSRDSSPGSGSAPRWTGGASGSVARR